MFCFGVMRIRYIYTYIISMYVYIYICHMSLKENSWGRVEGLVKDHPKSGLKIVEKSSLVE